MPWKETDAMQEKVRFVLEWERRWNAAEGGRVDVAELCRRFGVSRQTGYLWVRRNPGVRTRVRPQSSSKWRTWSSRRARCIDFKGKFRTGDGQWCHVLTLLDAWSRYLLRCEVVRDPDGDAVERILDSAFQELTPAEDAAAQQRQLDPWRREYNEERPHQALGQRPPAHLYQPSPWRYPRKLLRPQPESWTDVCRVENDGCIRWHRRKLHVTNALVGEYVELERIAETRWEVRYGSIVLGIVNTENMDHGMIRRRIRIAAVSGMSVG